MLLTTIRQAVMDRWVEDVDAAKLNRLIDAAVRYYSRYNPLIEEITLTTTAGKKEYVLEDEGAKTCLGISEVIWYPSGEISSEVYGDTLNSAPYTMPSHAVIDDINRSARIRGAYTYNNGTLTLYHAGTEVVVRYYTPHVITENTSYDTIPDADLELIVDLVLADLLDQKGFAAAISPDYTEGLEKVSFSKMQQAAGGKAEELRSMVSRKYGGVAVASAP